MNWLEQPKDETERFLKEALDSAKERTGDEIFHRRVWAKVATLHDVPEPKRSFRFTWVAASAGLVLAGAFAAYVHFRSPATGIAVSPPAAKSATESIDIVELRGKVVRTGVEENLRVALGGGAEAHLSANSTVRWDQQSRPHVVAGKARFHVPHQPPGWNFSVTAGPYLITVVGTKFDVDIRERTVLVSVTEGVVEVGHGLNATRLLAGDTWEGPRFPDEATQNSERPAPAQQKSKSALATDDIPSARAALKAGNPAKAADILARLAAGTGPNAENAAYELALVTRDSLHKPRQAIALWEKYRRRFPSGILRAETDLSIVETLTKLGQHEAALSEANRFLTRHPNSERRAELGALIERLQKAENDERGR